MSELISGKEALIALANGESVQKRSDSLAGDHWLDISKKEPFNLDCFLSGLNRHGETIKFRLKPRTITINGIELNQCYSVAIDYTRNEVKVEFKNRNDAEALHDVISKLYGFK